MNTKLISLWSTRTLVAVAFVALATSAVLPQSAHADGIEPTWYSDGSSFSDYNPSWYSNGSSYSDYSNPSWYSNGSSYSDYSNPTWYSNGSSYSDYNPSWYSNGSSYSDYSNPTWYSDGSSFSDYGCGYGCADDMWVPATYSNEPYTYTSPSYTYEPYTYATPTYSYEPYTYSNYSYQPYQYNYQNDYSSYDYSYDYHYEYDYEVDTHNCSDYGQIGNYPNCHYPQESQPVCAISASDTSIDDGDSTTLHWTSEYASSASSNFGSVSTGGSKTVSPNHTTTYTLTVFGINGGKDTCSTTVHVDEDNNNDDLWCELDASDTSVEEGDRITLEWDTRGADYASINQGIGRVDEDGGTERVTIDDNGDVTFRMTVRNNDGDEEDCSVRVNVDGENDFSSVTFYGEPTNNPPTVYLSSLPYTGLEDITPSMWAFYLVLVAGAGLLGYFFFVNQHLLPFAFATGTGVTSEEVEGEITSPSTTDEAITNFVRALESNDNDTIIDSLRSAAVNGTGVEEFIEQAQASTFDLATRDRLSAALVAAKDTGIRGAKEALIA